jgi:hypothetical protein
MQLREQLGRDAPRPLDRVRRTGNVGAERPGARQRAVARIHRDPPAIIADQTARAVNGRGCTAEAYRM